MSEPESPKTSQVSEGIASAPAPLSQARSGADRTGAKQDRASQMRLWFWGTVIALAVATISLSILAELRDPDSARGEQASDATTGELSPDALSGLLSETNAAALALVKAEIPGLLEEAYAPVYAAIPIYTDFHYSVWGSYVELGTAALGDPTEKLEEILLANLEERLDDVVYDLDVLFADTFREQLSDRFGQMGEEGVSLRPLTNAVVKDALGQTGTSVLVIVGGAGASKTLAVVMGKKVGAKIAAKAATKAGAKWGAATTGAIGGGALCAWAGPGAGLCAAGGAVAAWLATDAAVGVLDELISRDEFEAELRQLIYEDKAARLAALEHALTEKAGAIQTGIDNSIQDFTLRQLSGMDAAEVCHVVSDLSAQYDAMRAQIRNRRPEEVARLRAVAGKHFGNLSLSLFARELDGNLSVFASRGTLQVVSIRGNLPPGFRENREVSGQLFSGEEMYEFDRSPASEEGGFQIRVTPAFKISDLSRVELDLWLEQHRRVFPNRFFFGESVINVFEAMPDDDGISTRIYVPMAIAVKDDSDADGQAEDTSLLGLEITLRGEPIPDLQFPPKC